MVVLVRMTDPLLLQILCDALSARGIVCRVENAGMNALMPLPGVMDARVLVEEREYRAARRVLEDLDMSGSASEDGA